MSKYLEPLPQRPQTPEEKLEALIGGNIAALEWLRGSIPKEGSTITIGPKGAMEMIHNFLKAISSAITVMEEQLQQDVPEEFKKVAADIKKHATKTH